MAQAFSFSSPIYHDITEILLLWCKNNNQKQNQSHYPDTEHTSHYAILVILSTRLGSSKRSYCKPLVWLGPGFEPIASGEVGYHSFCTAILSDCMHQFNEVKGDQVVSFNAYFIREPTPLGKKTQVSISISISISILPLKQRQYLQQQMCPMRTWVA